MAASVDVVGPSPIGFTNSNGDQKVIPLSALEFNGSQIALKTAWQTPLSSTTDQTILLKLAQALATAGVLTPPPAPPPAPALGFTAARTGLETNNINVTATTAGTGGPLAIQITLTATEADTWSSLGSGANAAKVIGVDKPTGKPGDPAVGTGLIVVVQGSAGPGIPVASSGTLQKGQTADLLESDGKTKVCTIAARADYQGAAGLKYTVVLDSSGQSFTITAKYDSSKEKGGTTAITVLTLSKLPDPLAYLVSVSVPPTGALVPANNSSVQLSGGAPGIAATGLLYA
ncbi:hypothetical protein [Mycobacterium sp.]|uniref:hypothetical protein n=1 Tax=Mycobacterium sp. TaxID=1785 RepID=UPI003F9888B5